MAGRRCDGKVRSLKGRTICFTGRALVDGKWMVRKRCAEKAKRLGATYRTDFSGGVTLVVYGDLAGKVVTDPRRDYSSTLVDAEEERSRGRHVCVVDGDGFSNLLRHRSAPCLELRRTGQGRVRPVAPPETGDDILGGALWVQRVGRHAPKDLTMDLDNLDKATAAHESTVGALSRTWVAEGSTYARTPGTRRDSTPVGRAAQRSSSPRSRA